MSQYLTVEKIRKKLRAPKPTNRRIAEIAGISETHLSNIMHKRRNVTETVEQKILSAYQQAWEEVK